MTKLIILGIDALEIGLIEEINLVALKQKQYGEIKVPLSSVSGYPRSPSVWATFLIGKEVEIEFVLAEPPSLNRFGSLNDVGFVEWTGVKSINVPYYNHEIDTLRSIINLHSQRLANEGNAEVQHELIRSMIDTHSARTKEILGEVIKAKDSPRHNVIFAYIQTLDTLQHYLFSHQKTIKRLYRELDVLVANAKKQLGDNIIIIVSDHGFKDETHSHKGYYSCSHPMKEKPTNITDFHKVVRDFLCS